MVARDHKGARAGPSQDSIGVVLNSPILQVDPLVIVTDYTG